MLAVGAKYFIFLMHHTFPRLTPTPASLAGERQIVSQVVTDFTDLTLNLLTAINIHTVNLLH